MKNDLQSRIAELGVKISKKRKANGSVVQNKLNKFVIEIGITENEVLDIQLSEYEREKVRKDIEKLRKDAEDIQNTILGQEEMGEKRGNERVEDGILKNLEFLREISKQMLGELETQNTKLEKKLGDVDNCQEELEKTRKKFSRTERCVDKCSDYCLFTTMITLMLIIVLITSIL